MKTRPDTRTPIGEAPRGGGRRRWPARLAAVVLAPLLLLLGLEAGLRAFGYGHDTAYFVPAEKEGSLRSNLRFSERFLGPELARDPMPVLLTKAKPAGTYRVFVFGGSAAQGVPDSAFSFARVLEAMLRDRYPGRRLEVVNTAMTAVNSHVVRQIVRDCGGLGGDLYIVYMGHNEVVGPYGPGSVVGSAGWPLWVLRASMAARSTRTGQLLAEAIRGVSGGAAGQPKWAGMETFAEHRLAEDDPALSGVYDHFRANLQDICSAARQAGAGLIVSTVLTNLKDCPPFASAHRPGLSAADRQRWQALCDQAARRRAQGDLAGAVECYRRAEEIDDRHARLHFDLGQCLLGLGRPEPARHHLTRARDLDMLRFRADTRINEIIRQVAGGRQAEGIRLVDLDPPGEAGDLPGEELLYEHVHLTFEGNCAVAARMFQAVAGLLPAEASGGAGGRPQPPSVQRCAELLLYTPCDRYAAAVGILQMTEAPPFGPLQAQRDRDRAQRLGALVTPASLDRAADAYVQAQRDRPDDLLTRECFARLQTARRRPDLVEQQCRELLRRCPGYRSWSMMLGAALYRDGKVEQGIAEFRTALKARPDEPRGHVRLGRILLDLGRAKEARECFEAAVRLAPDEPEFHFQLARAREAAGQFRPAVESYRQSIRLDPRQALPVSHLARIYATCPDDGIRNGRTAVSLAEQACSLAGQPSAGLLDTLAAAYAEAGRKALALAELAGQAELAGEVRKHLALFTSGRPVRRPGP